MALIQTFSLLMSASRLAMGCAPAILPHEYFMLSAGLYFTSHLLDQIDGKVRLNILVSQSTIA